MKNPRHIFCRSPSLGKKHLGDNAQKYLNYHCRSYTANNGDS